MLGNFIFAVRVGRRGREGEAQVGVRAELGQVSLQGLQPAAGSADQPQLRRRRQRRRHLAAGRGDKGALVEVWCRAAGCADRAQLRRRHHCRDVAAVQKSHGPSHDIL